MAKAKAKEKKPETYQERLDWAHKHFISDEADPNIPPPTYHYRVGESVRIGNLHDPRVEEVLRDGRLLHVSYHDKGEKYGKPFDNQRRLPGLWWWIDVEPVATVEDTHFSRPRIRSQYTQTSLQALLGSCYRRGLIDSPTYQRDYVWTLEDKQRLIQSVMNRMDIGKFVFLTHPHPEWRWEIVDGKQRLRALMDFYEGRFEFRGKTWFQLSHDDKWAFEDQMVQITELNSAHVSQADILWLFLAINTGGVPQTPEHVARAQRLYEEALLQKGERP